MNAEQAKQAWRDGFYQEYCNWSKYVNRCVNPLNLQANFDEMIDFNYWIENRPVTSVKELVKEAIRPHIAPEAGEAPDY